MTSWSELPLTEEHAAYLREQAAITAEVAHAAGIRSATTVDELPEWARDRRWAEQAVPAVIYPWVDPEGNVYEQIRPDVVLTWDGEEHKYLFPSGCGAVLNTIVPANEDTETVLIVEGTKQGFAAGSYAPEKTAVYAIGGCRNWSTDGIPSTALMVVEGKKVVIALDADTSSNVEVYNAGLKLAEVCTLEGAESVNFIRLGAMGTKGLDDVLAARPETGRAGHLARLIAKAKAKPADTKPAAKKAAKAVVIPQADATRPRIYMDQDRLDVINQVTQALIARWNTTKMFDHGGVLSILSTERRLGQAETPVLMVLDKRTMTDLVQETIQSVRSGANGELIYCYPEGATLDAIFSRYRLFAPIDRIARVPFVRRDGSICQTPGYDVASFTYLALDPNMQVVHVPDDPTGDDLAWAVKLIREEWLHDFFNNMPDEASRTNTVALALTPFIRGLVPVVPMAVVDGLQMGVGKNLLADVAVAIPATGDGVEPMNWDQQDDAENRKQITSAFKDGADVYVFDEAHRLHGASLARVITAATWKDRNLGHSQMLGFRNQVTWVSLGNNVEVAGDIVRRVYRIALRPDCPNPQDRPSSAFRIPNIRRWTIEHRVDIITAMLILVRAWFAAGQPLAQETSFGSFEEWERIVGGILAHAGFTDFLGNTASWRRESNYDQQHWIAHVHWLWDVFGDKVFSTNQVREAMQSGPHAAASEPPPGLTDLTVPAKDYNRALGKAYGRLNGVFFDGVKLIKAEQMMHRGVQGWRVFGPDDDVTDSDGSGPLSSDNQDGGGKPDTDGAGDSPGSGPLSYGSEAAVEGVEGTEGGISPTHHEEKVSTRAARAHTHVFSTGSDGISSPSTPSTPSVQDVKPYDTRLRQHESVIPDTDQPSLFKTLDDGEYERLAPADYEGTATETLPPDVLVFDIEGPAAEKVFTGGPDFLKIFGYQSGDRLRVTENVHQAVELIKNSRVISGHNIMNFDLITFALHHDLDIHQAAADGRFWDTQLVEVLLNPPPYWMEASQVPAKYKLDVLGQQKFGIGKSHDLKALVKKHGGAVPPKASGLSAEFEKIPNDDAEYVTYCAADVDLTARLARSQRVGKSSPLGDYIRREHRIAAIATQISMNGMKVDIDLLHERVRQVESRKTELRQKLIDVYGLPTTKKDGTPSKGMTEAGRAAIEAAFADLGVTLPRSKSGRGPATDKATMNELAAEYADRPEIVELVETVQGFNGQRTVYGSALAALHPDGRVHPNINMYQSTGRWSVTKPGMTVFGKRGGRHVEREIFIPDEGEVIIAADLSQVDARAIAAWCQDPEYLKMFDPGMDLHEEVALQMFGTKDRRDDAKALSHGYNYGLGFNKLAKAHGPELARSFLDTMESKFPRLVEWKNEIRRESADNGYRLDNGWGKPLVIDPDSNFTQAPALVGQSAARDIMMQGLLNLPRWILPMLRVQVHDEIVLSVPEDRVDEIKAIVVDALSFPWRPFNGARGHEREVQILADSGKHGSNWGEVYAK